MEIKLGIRHLNRELAIETDKTADELKAAVNSAFVSDEAVLEITDTKGHTVMVPGRQLAYVELGEETTRQVGFGAL